MAKTFDIVKEQAVGIDPRLAAKNCSFDYKGSIDQGFFAFSFFNRLIKLQFPDFTGHFQDDDSAVPEFIVILVMYHLLTSDGLLLQNEWISYASLPGGEYEKVMKGYTSRLLEGHFLNDIEALEVLAVKIGAVSLQIPGDIALKFSAFPMVPIVLVYWKGDDEFPPQANFLFDKSAAHHLPSDCYAMLCSWLTRSLISR